ncbi:MAG: hypothetical protein Fur0025_07700 [Oscillatoriaceae cyanobacterium]
MTKTYLFTMLIKSGFLSKHKGAKGFTLLEVLVVVLIVGILATTAGVGWLGFVNRQRVNGVQNAALRAIEKAQLEARSRQLSYSISFRVKYIDTPDIQGYFPQYAIHPTYKADSDSLTGSSPLNPNNTSQLSEENWKSLGEGLDIKGNQILLCTNLAEYDPPNTTGNNQLDANTTCKPGDLAKARTITFDDRGTLPAEVNLATDANGDGTPDGLPITLAAAGGDYMDGQPTISSKRCVKLITLLGATTTAQGDACPSS